MHGQPLPLRWRQRDNDAVQTRAVQFVQSGIQAGCIALGISGQHDYLDAGMCNRHECQPTDFHTTITQAPGVRAAVLGNTLK